ncbi:MAG: sulfatase-like hydrolase/transferase [Opitutaceae bacterium]|nr:sulfatase-like hydrolase/transferase [Opitutaceae bacterium]
MLSSPVGSPSRPSTCASGPTGTLALRKILRGAIFLGVGISVLGAAEKKSTAGAARTTPNIVLIVTDDQGYGDCTSNWKTDLQTPFMDEIARHGVRFTQFRVNPLCSPTRSSIMTGLYSLENGMWRGPGESARAEPAGGWPADERRIKDNVIMLPQLLKKQGYTTGAFGKWHLGYDKVNVPGARGFDQFFGFLGGAHPYWLVANSRVEDLNGKPVNAGHTTDLFADHAIAFIRENKDRPFFCYLPFNAVHGPLRRESSPRDSAKPEWLAYYEKRGVPQPRRDYCAVMTHADARIGDVLKTLRELGLEKNTLVICLSDNGGILHDYPSNNGPLRGGKGETYEGGIRVPAMMMWPGVIPAGTVSKADAVHFDLFATILDAAGAPVPPKNGAYPVHGVSLLPHAKSKAQSPLPERYLFWDLYGDVGAVHGKWKLVGDIGNHSGDFARAVAETEKAQFELYNLDEDIGEKNNLAARFPDIYADLKQRHLEWLRQFAREGGAAKAAMTPEERAAKQASRAERKAGKKKAK